MKLSKRLFDLSCSSLAIIFLLPILILVYLLIIIEDGGRAIFVQERVGYRGRKFRLYKFRTMHVNAEKKGGLLTIGKDPRITKFGAFLRKYKIDELPQLFNVIKGDMSLVGPRPEVEKYVNLYSEDQKRILELYPGITDMASIKYIDESEILSKSNDPEMFYVKFIMNNKIELNMEYINRMSLPYDILIIIKTISKIFKRN